jgi:hypothetical protein
LADANESGDEYAEPKKLVRKWWIRLVDEIVGKIQEQKSKKNQEEPADRAARRTAWATVVIAFFTVALAFVGYFQLDEMKSSGVESSGQIDQLTHEFRSQVAQMKRQSEEMHDLADRTKQLAAHMKDQADRTRVIAQQAIVQANAAKSAAETAKQALHVSERAYVILGIPIDDFQHKRINIPIVNSGHVPSGIAKVVVHEATFKVEDQSMKVIPLDAAIEWHWRENTYQTVPVVPTGNLMSIEVDLPNIVQDQIETGKQMIVITALVTYNDGFQNTEEQTYLFCDSSSYTASTKLFSMRPCDYPNAIMSNLTVLDKYPSPTYQEK